MENPRPEKVAVVDEVREKLTSASAAILTEYRGLKVKDLEGLRRSLRDAGGEYKVYKNTLVRFAARDMGLDGLEELLTGPTAITFVDGDAVAVAKALRDYARTNPALVVKGGVLGTSILDAKAAGALAELPSREVLLARIAGGLAAPMVQFAGLLQALPRNFAYGLKALIDKGGSGDAPEATEAAATPPADDSPAVEVAEPAGEAEATTEAAAEPAAEEAPAADAPAEEAVVDPAQPADEPVAADAPAEGEPTSESESDTTESE